MSELSTVDRAILLELQNNARITNKELASRVGLSPSTCLDHVARLCDQGVINGYRADIDPAAVGRPVQALIAVRLAAHSRTLVDNFVGEVRSFPETLAIHHVSGPVDFIVHVACGGITDLQRLILDEFTARREVSHVETNMVFSSWDGGPVEPYDLTSEHL